MYLLLNFKVTEEEDDLWSSLPQPELASQNEQLQYLQNKLSGMKEQTQELNSQGPQLVFVSTNYFKFFAQKLHNTAELQR